MKTLDYERYIFRVIKQEREESFDSFVGRLKIQAKKCYFCDVDSQMKDQILEKCHNNDLRKEAFENLMSLQQLIYTAKTLENVKKKSRSSRSKSRCSNPTSSRRESLRKPDRDQDRKSRERSRSRFDDRVKENSNRQSIHEDTDRSKCTRCGFNNHYKDNTHCPAIKSNCGLCNKIGHFSRMCWNTRLGNNRPNFNVLPENTRNVSNINRVATNSGSLNTNESKTFTAVNDNFSKTSSNFQCAPSSSKSMDHQFQTKVEPTNLVKLNQSEQPPKGVFLKDVASLLKKITNRPQSQSQPQMRDPRTETQQ